MSITLVEISEEEFHNQYPLLRNHLNPEDGPGCYFETYGVELEFVHAQDPRTVWTFIEGDNGTLYYVSGYHVVNRIGYLISTNPVPEGTDIEVRIPMPTDESEA